MAELEKHGLENGSDCLTHTLRGDAAWNSPWTHQLFQTHARNGSNRNPLLRHYGLGSMSKRLFSSAHSPQTASVPRVLNSPKRDATTHFPYRR